MSHVPFHGNALVLIVGRESSLYIRDMRKTKLIHNVGFSTQYPIYTHIVMPFSVTEYFLIEKITRIFFKEKVFSHSLLWGDFYMLLSLPISTSEVAYLLL